MRLWTLHPQHLDAKGLLVQAVLAGKTQGYRDHPQRYLLRKLEQRDPERYRLSAEARPLPHPLFSLIPGPVRDWEKIADR